MPLSLSLSHTHLRPYRFFGFFLRSAAGSFLQELTGFYVQVMIALIKNNDPDLPLFCAIVVVGSWEKRDANAVLAFSQEKSGSASITKSPPDCLKNNQRWKSRNHFTALRLRLSKSCGVSKIQRKLIFDAPVQSAG